MSISDILLATLLFIADWSVFFHRQHAKCAACDIIGDVVIKNLYLKIGCRQFNNFSPKSCPVVQVTASYVITIISQYMEKYKYIIESDEINK